MKRFRYTELLIVLNGIETTNFLSLIQSTIAFNRTKWN